MTGHVYFIECAGRIKIGYSADAVSRVKTLSTAAPTPLKMLGFVDGSRSLEKALHLKPFNDHREWFSDCPEVRALVADVLARGSAAIEFKEKPPRAIPAPTTREPRAPEWWEVATKGMTAIFNRYEYTILNHPDKTARKTAFVVLRKAQDALEGMMDRAVDDRTDSDAMTKIQRWLAGVETQLSAAVSVKAA